MTERVVVPLRTWAEDPCSAEHGYAEGLIVDRGGKHLVYVCWCGEEVDVARDDEEVVAAMAATTNGAKR